MFYVTENVPSGTENVPYGTENDPHGTENVPHWAENVHYAQCGQLRSEVFVIKTNPKTNWKLKILDLYDRSFCGPVCAYSWLSSLFSQINIYFWWPAVIYYKLYINLIEHSDPKISIIFLKSFVFIKMTLFETMSNTLN